MKNRSQFVLARIAMLLLTVFMSLTAWAENITAEQALQQAQSFLKSHKAANGRRNAPAAAPQMKLAGQVSGLYVFNATDGGFVIVSNDDRTVPVLGYSDSGSFDPATMPANMRAWLQGYADEIAWLQQHKSMVKTAPSMTPSQKTPAVKADIGALVSTRWNQGTPYNNQTPYYKYDGGNYYYSATAASDYEHCVTGCVATAMAQVMKYHEWPKASTTAIPSYQWGETGITLPELATVTFDWNNMTNTYTTATTGVTADAVATLMKYCGWSVQMAYGPSSGAQSVLVANALKSYFGYNTTTKVVSRSNYTYANWIELMYHELAELRPVVYGGQSSGGGHEFVVDGYKYEDNTDYFHINWGWGGQSDEYFVLSSLNPNDQGIGGSSSDDGYHYGQDATIGIQRPTESGTVLDVPTVNVNFSLNSITLSNNRRVNQPLTITVDLKNSGSDEYSGDIGLRVLYQNNGEWYYVADISNDVLIPANSTSTECAYTFTPPYIGDYAVQVYHMAGDAGYIYWIGAQQFFDVADLDVPTELTVSDIGSRSAVMSWEGSCDSYKYQYRTPGNDATHFFDDFESGLSQWTIYTEGEGDGWFPTDPSNDLEFNAHSGSIVAAAFSWNGSAFNADNWLITPQLNLQGTLKFWVRTNPSCPDKYEVKLSTGGKAISDFTVTLQTMDNAPGDWTEVSIGLSSYAGQKGYIAIHHKSNDKNYLLIDDFGVYTTAVPAGEWIEAYTDETSATITGLDPNTTYECQVFGINDDVLTDGTPLVEFTTLKELTLGNNAKDNSDVIGENIGQTVSVILTDRTLAKDGEWNTICLPFEVMLEGSPLEGAEARTLESATMVGTHVTLHFGNAVTSLLAGVPYIIKWDADTENPAIEEPVFDGVTIDPSNYPVSLANDNVHFIGYYDAFGISASDDDIYYMGAGSTLKHTAKARTLKACRAYFRFEEAAQARDITLDFGDGEAKPTGVGAALMNNEERIMNNEVYDLQGRRIDGSRFTVNGSRLNRGIYIKNGRKVVVK